MALQNPAALWLLAAAVAAVLLLSRLRRPRVRRIVGNAYLWPDAPAAPNARPRRRLRVDALLFLQIACVTALALAAARPLLSRAAAEVAIVVDVSASMGARESSASTTRLDRAKRHALDLVRRLPRGSSVRLITAKPAPALLGPFTADDPALARAVDRLRPTAGRADLIAAIQVARAASREARIFVVTDDGGRATDLPDGIERIAVGEPAENVAITRLEARALPASPLDAELFIEVRNFGSGLQTVPLVIRQDAREILRDTIRIGGRASYTSVRAVSGSGVLTAAVDVVDALDADNRRFAAVRPADRIRVRLATGGSFFLERALSANPALTVEVVPLAGFDRETGKRPDVLVCDGCDGPPGGSDDVLVVRPIDEATARAGVLSVEQPSHPIVSFVSGDRIDARVAPLDAPGWADVLMRAGPDPALVAYEENGRRIVDVALDVRRGGLPLHVSFPVLIAGAIEWLAARGANPVAIAPGAPLQWRVRSAESGSAEIIGADGRTLQARRMGRLLTTIDTDAPGPYRVRGRDTIERFVVNVAPEESDLAPAGPGTPAGRADVSASGVTRADLSAVLLLAAVGLVGAEWRAWRRRTPPPARAAYFARAFVLCLALASLVGPRVTAGEAPASVVFALDRSASVADSARQGAKRIEAMTASMRPNDRVALVAFAASASVERRLLGARLVVDAASDIPSHETNIEAALRAARALLPDQGDRRIVLLSDGRGTAGDATREAAYAAAYGVGVDVVPLGGRRAPARARAVLTRVSAPSAVRAGQPFGVDVRLEGTPGARARVSVQRDAAALAARETTIEADGTATITVVDRAPAPGLFVYRAVAESVVDGEESDAGAVVAASGRPRVCVVANGSSSTGGLLSPGGFEIVRFAPEALPASAPGLARCDAIALDDVPPETLPAAGLDAIAHYVEQLGGGLILSGGPRSLYPAGYSATPLARVLPVDLRRRAGRRAPELALVLVLDKSGSMADAAAGATKIELARRAVAAVLDAVPAGDAVGVIAFDRAPSAIVPLAAGHEPRTVQERLRAIQPGGPTAIAPALALAGDWLATSPAARKHVLLVSDGRSPPEDEARVRAWAERRAAALSIVATGEDVDRQFLRSVAERSGGRAYFPDDLGALPRIVAREAARASSGWRIDEPFTSRLSRHAILAGLEAAGAPAMRGYVGATARPGADVVLRSHLDDPILAGWRFGLGRVVVFTSGLSSAWAAPLRGWSGFGALWTQTVRWVSRPGGARGLRAAWSARDGVARLAVDATRPDGRFANFLDVSAVIRVPGRDDAEQVTLEQTAPGRYEAIVATGAGRAGAYLAAVTARDPTTSVEERAAAGLYESGAAERRSTGVDLSRLQAIARAGGGAVLGEADSPFAGPRPAAERPLREWLAALAVLAFVADVARRRGVGRARLAGAWRALALRARPRAAA